MRKLPTQKAGARNSDQPVLRNYTVRTLNTGNTQVFNEVLQSFKANGVKTLSEKGSWVKCTGKGLVEAVIWQELKNGTMPELSDNPCEAMLQAFEHTLFVVATREAEGLEEYFTEDAPIGA